MSAETAVSGTPRPRTAVPALVLRVMATDGRLAEAAIGRARATVGPFEVTASSGPPTGPAGRQEVTVTLTCVAPNAVSAGIIVAGRLPPTTSPRWLIPGLFYGENGTSASRVRYPRYTAGPPDPANFVSDSWDFRADRAASPVVFGWGDDGGLALATEDVTGVGRTGVGFGRVGPESGGAEIRLDFPYREVPVAYDGSDIPGPPDVPLHEWRPGETVSLSLAVYVLAAAGHAYAPVLRDMHAHLAPRPSPRPWVDIGTAADLAAEGLLRWHYLPAVGVLRETAAFDRHGDGRATEPLDRAAMHVAWLSGVPPAAALLRHGRRRDDQAAVRAGVRVIDTIVANPAPCGTLWGQWTAERGWGKGWTPGEHRLHARTLGEAVLFLGRAAGWEMAAGHDRPGWHEAVRRNLEFVVDRQRDDGAIPASWHGLTGAPEDWRGCAGLAWVPALVDGARRYDEPSWQLAAEAAGRYYERFVDAEYLHGAPEDTDLAPTSEDGYVAVMGYVSLLESATRPETRAHWLDVACRAADWTLTFRYSRNLPFEPGTVLGDHDFRTMGADQASVANQHLHAYGLVCLGEMVRLARHAGDTWYLDRSRENLACFRQFIAREDGDFGARRGMAPERFFQTAYGGPVGSIGPLSHAWCLGLLLAACNDAADYPELADG